MTARLTLWLLALGPSILHNLCRLDFLGQQPTDLTVGLADVGLYQSLAAAPLSYHDLFGIKVFSLYCFLCLHNGLLNKVWCMYLNYVTKE